MLYPRSALNAGDIFSPIDRKIARSNELEMNRRSNTK